MQAFDVTDDGTHCTDFEVQFKRKNAEVGEKGEEVGCFHESRRGR